MILLKDTTQWPRWSSNPRPLGLESSALPLSHCAPWLHLCFISKNSLFYNGMASGAIFSSGKLVSAVTDDRVSILMCSIQQINKRIWDLKKKQAQLYIWFYGVIRRKTQKQRVCTESNYQNLGILQWKFPLQSVWDWNSLSEVAQNQVH